MVWTIGGAWTLLLLLQVLVTSPAAAVQLPVFLRGLISPLATVFTGKHKCSPSQVHLAVTGRPDEMRVMWKTHSRSCPTTVHYGETSLLGRPALPMQLQHRQGSVRSYSGEDMCASPARDYVYDTSALHDVVLSDLVPRKWYSYRVAHSKRIMRFQAPPPPGRKEGFQFLAYGDMGDPHHRQAKAPGAKGTVHYVRRDIMAGADMVVHVGDLSYANGREYVWNSFMDSIEPAASRAPYMVAVGNHEYDYTREGGRKESSVDPSGASDFHPGWGNYGNDSGGECGVSVVNRFTMPGSDLRSSLPLNSSTTTIGSLGRAAAADEAGLRSGTDAAMADTEQHRSNSLDFSSRRSGEMSSVSTAAATEQRHAEQQSVPNCNSNSSYGRSISSGHVAGKCQPQLQPLLTAASAAVAIVSSEMPAGTSEGTAVSSTQQRKRRRAANPPFWYSFDYGAVHFVAVSSEHDLRHSSDQAKWLRGDLGRVESCVTPWVVLLMHRPMYVVFPHKSNRVVAEHLRQQLEQTLNDFEVDLVLSGHVHSYARTCNVLDGNCIPLPDGGTTHITLGCGGHQLSDVNHQQPVWLEAAQLHYGYGRITVHDGYDLTFEYVRSMDGKVYDSKTFHNERADRLECFVGGTRNSSLLTSHSHVRGGTRGNATSAA